MWNGFPRPGEAEKTIRFQARQLTVREFAETVESQSEFRLNKVCCGNGWTILWGDYGGLYMATPEVAAE
jgi:hypothetical protein